MPVSKADGYPGEDGPGEKEPGKMAGPRGGSSPAKDSDSGEDSAEEPQKEKVGVDQRLDRDMDLLRPRKQKAAPAVSVAARDSGRSRLMVYREIFRCASFVGFVLNAMSWELELKTLQGGVISVEVVMETTLRELKAMLLEKHPRAEDPIERKLLAVELLRDSSIMEVDDAQTLGAAGLLEAKAITTAIYKRNEVEAATKDGIHTREFFHLNIPSICTNISWQAFQDCTHLVSVAMNESSVTHIDECAFYGCTSLARITFGESVTHIKYNAFRKCKSLESLTLGDSVTHIENSAFEECSSLASITLGECVAHIGNSAFSGCTALQTITLGASVTYIGVCAFQDCMSLQSITLGESVTQIEGSAFHKCTPLESITLGESVTHIGDGAFYGCTSLASITLGESVTHIRNSAFYGCTYLASITLGESVTHIGNNAFGGCTSLASITLGESVTHIGHGAFYSCTSLASITLGESVTHIGDGAFEGCTSLASITLGESVTHIGNGAFSGCTSLDESKLARLSADLSTKPPLGCVCRRWVLGPSGYCVMAVPKSSICSFNVSKLEEVSKEMLILALQTLKLGGRSCVLFGTGHALEAWVLEKRVAGKCCAEVLEKSVKTLDGATEVAEDLDSGEDSAEEPQKEKVMPDRFDRDMDLLHQRLKQRPVPQHLAKTLDQSSAAAQVPPSQSAQEAEDEALAIQLQEDLLKETQDDAAIAEQLQAELEQEVVVTTATVVTGTRPQKRPDLLAAASAVAAAREEERLAEAEAEDEDESWAEEEVEQTSSKVGLQIKVRVPEGVEAFRGGTLCSWRYLGGGVPDWRPGPRGDSSWTWTWLLVDGPSSKSTSKWPAEHAVFIPD
eukprot:symbB.v1.2.022953.t1/scaffold2070.1/size90664/1